ncbi:MAG: response regulator transcription factor [Chromatiaceae bacterium]|nr:response regulator transcription factor [Candidatus Thioaporhodococcus sediminis]
MKILLADDHPLFREGVKPVLKKLEDEVTIIEAMDFPSAFDTTHRHRDLDLALLDLNMPGMAGVDGVIRFRATFPDIPVVVLSAAEDSAEIQHLLNEGASGYISKSSPSDLILSALRLVQSGGIYVPTHLLSANVDAVLPDAKLMKQYGLTYRQLQVLRELANGLSNKQIAKILQVTEGTIKVHMASIFRQLNVNNRTEALLVAQKMGLDKSHG